MNENDEIELRNKLKELMTNATKSNNGYRPKRASLTISARTALEYHNLGGIHLVTKVERHIMQPTFGVMIHKVTEYCVLHAMLQLI